MNRTTSRFVVWSDTIPQLTAIIGATHAQLCEAVNREFGSVTRFCAHIGFTGKK
jgi:hypothetical protein